MRTLALAALFALLPVVADAAPVPKEVLRKIESLEGTTWSGDGVVAPTVYSFLKNGVLSYSYNGATHTSGTWKQDGHRIYWETNNRYCEFDGTFTSRHHDGQSPQRRQWAMGFKNVETEVKQFKSFAVAVASSPDCGSNA